VQSVYISLSIRAYIPQVAFFLPQLVQLLRSDENGMITNFLIGSAMQSVVFAHHLICTLRVSPLCGNNSEVAVTFPLVLVTRFMIWENQMHDEFLLQNEVLANAA